MDTPTHGLIGRLVARSIWPEKSQTGLVNLVTVCSVLPDLDVLIPGNGLEGLVTHRGISHSFLGIVVCALAVAWLARKIGLKHLSYVQVYLASVFGLLLHISFDVVTTYGTVIFAPFSDYRASLDVLFIIDPYLDVLLIGGLLLGWRSRLGARGYRIAAGAAAAYVLAAGLITGIGHWQVRSWAAAQGVSVDRASVMPTPFSPLHRRGMIASGDRVYWLPMTLFGGVAHAPTVYVNARTDVRLQGVWDSRVGEIYSWFARFPIVRPLPERDDALLVQDLQFMFVMEDKALGWLGSWAARLALDHNPDVFDRRIFSLEVEMDTKQHVRQVFYLKQNERGNPYDPLAAHLDLLDRCGADGGMWDGRPDPIRS